jgi:nascent polypeptide-associated complex subunit alpha
MQIEDMNSQAQLSAAQQLAAGGGLGGGATIEQVSKDDDDIPELEAVEDEGPVDETDVDQKDIELVMQQVNCSRAKAVKALKESGGDLINASMSFQVVRFASLNKQSFSHGCKRIVDDLLCPLSCPNL